MVYFFKYAGKQKRVTDTFDSMDAVDRWVREKFHLDGALQFTIKDQKYGEFFELDGVGDLYDGAVIEVKLEGAEEEGGEEEEEQKTAAATAPDEQSQEEITLLKRKIAELEDEKTARDQNQWPLAAEDNSASSSSSSSAPKRPRIDISDGVTPVGGATADTDISASNKTKEVEGWVSLLRGLSYHNDEDSVRDFFEGLTIVRGGIFIVRSEKGLSVGDGYVTFATEEERDESVKKHKEMLEKRYIEVYPRTPQDVVRAIENSKILLGLQDLPIRPGAQLIRLRGMPFKTTKEDVEAFFEGLEHPPFAIHMMVDHLGRRNGDAFVEFESPKDANSGMKLNRQYIGNRYVEMYRSGPDEMRVSLAVGKVNESESSCVKLLGLPYNCTDEDVTAFFLEVGVTPTRIHRKTDGGEAYVEFRSVTDTDRALSRHKAYIGNRYIEVYRVEYRDMARIVGLPLTQQPLMSATPAILQPALFHQPMMAPVLPQFYPPMSSAGYASMLQTNANAGQGVAPTGTMDPYSGQPVYGGTEASYQPSYGMPPEGYAAPAAGGVPTKVKLRGLPFKAAVGDVQHFFRTVPILKDSCEFVRDPEGRPTGDAYVTFGSLAEAELAVTTLDRQYIGDRYVVLQVMKEGEVSY